MTVKLHPMAAKSEAFLTKVHDAALRRLMAKLPLFMRKEWKGEAKQFETVNGGLSLQLILTHKCGYRLAHKRVFLNGLGSVTHAKLTGQVLGYEIYKDINNHKCSGREAPHLTIVKPWLCPICGVTEEKYPEWEGECDHVPDHKRTIPDRKQTKRKSKRVRERIGGRKGPAKARRKAVAKASRGDEDLCEQR